MPVWLCVTVYLAATFSVFVGAYAAGIGGFSALVGIAGGYVAVWIANLLWLWRRSPRECEKDPPKL